MNRVTTRDHHLVRASPRGAGVTTLQKILKKIPPFKFFLFILFV
jgi:hypothetical protein